MFFSIHVMAAILVVDVVIGCKFKKWTCENHSWQSTGLIFSGRTWGREVEEFTWHSRFKKCLLLSYLKPCASTTPSISIIQRKPHSKEQNYFTDYVYVIMQNKSTISTSKLFLQKLMIMGNNPIATLQTLHCSSHKGDNCEKLYKCI